MIHTGKLFAILGTLTVLGCSGGATQRPVTADSAPRPLCADDDLDRCFVLGLMLESGYSGKPDPARAATYYTYACDRGDADACYNLAVLEVEGRGVKEAPATARQRYREICDGGHAAGCANLGYLVSRGIGGEASADEAIGLYERSCELGSGVGCANYADRLIGSDNAAQRKRAVSAFASACRHGQVSGCVRHGWSLANDCTDKACQLEDEAALAKSTRDACRPDGSPRICATFAAHLLGGRHLGADPKQAREVARKACDAGDGWGCALHASAASKGIGGPVAHEDAHRSYLRGCEAEFAPACTAGGVQMVEGRGIERDTLGGYAALAQGCRGGDTDACNTLLLVCEQGDEAACAARSED